MKRIILTLMIMLSFISNIDASTETKLIRERNINQFENVIVNVPSKVVYHWSPIYSLAIKLIGNDEIELTNDNLDIINKNDKLEIDVKNLEGYELEYFYNTSPENIIINIYSPRYPEIKTTSRDLWVCNNYKNISTNYGKN